MIQSRKDRTRTCSMTIKPRRDLQPSEQSSTDQPCESAPSSNLMKNLSMSAALVLCVVALRAGAIPAAQNGVDAVLTAASGDTLLDDQLGRLSFVSSIFPEATLVFGESGQGVLTMPVESGSVVHAWSAQEPYTTWSSGEREVLSAMDGEVMGVYHANGDEVLLQLRGAGGLTCVYGNLAESSVSMGDYVRQGERVGSLLPNAEMVFEVRQDGVSVDPIKLLPSAQ